nr:hypothetical protein [uncultured Psychroserpens sp.]
MKKKPLNSESKIVINASDIPLESSLGLLAYGDIAFEAWRELKKQSRKDKSNE